MTFQIVHVKIHWQFQHILFKDFCLANMYQNGNVVQYAIFTIIYVRYIYNF